MRIITTIIIMLLSSIFLSAQNPNTGEIADNTSWIHLGTLWDAPGSISEISSTGEYAVIQQDRIMRLAHIFSGEIVLEVMNGNISFSDDGQYAIYYQYSSYTSTDEEYFSVLNLETGHSYELEGSFDSSASNEIFSVSVERHEGINNPTSQLRLFETGELIAEYQGYISTFSRDLSFVVVHRIGNIGEAHHRFYVLDIESDKILAEYSHPIPDYVYSGSSSFNVDDSLLAIYFFPDEMKIIDTNTWDVLYTLAGGISFSADGRYIAHNNHAGYSEVQLIEAHTGEVLDEFLGSLHFSHNGQYWIRGEALDYDVREWQIIEFDTEDTIYEYTGYGAPGILGDNLISIWDFTTQSTRFYDLDTNELIQEINGFIEAFGNYMIVDDTYTPFEYLTKWDTGETYATGRQIEISPTNDFALVSNGLFVDVYGTIDMQIINLTPPRSEEGIAQASPGELLIYPAPGSDNPRIITDGNMLNDTYFDVLGQSQDSHWLFVSFHSQGVNPERIIGWIQNENLEEIISWENVPILDSEDPINHLKTIAFNQS